MADPIDPLVGVRSRRPRRRGKDGEPQGRKGLRLREGIFEARPGTFMQARDLLASASFLNFLRWLVPGVFWRLRSGWDAANESGASRRLPWRP